MRKVWLLASVCFAASVAAVSSQERVSVKTSGEQWSGEGKDFSDWYYLSAEPPPNGYYLAAAEFRLVGDRACGAWAECTEIAPSRYSSTWRFRMQGHDESRELTRFFVSFDFAKDLKLNNPGSWPRVEVTLSGKKATSTGVLKVTYKPEPPADLPATIVWTKTLERWSGTGRDFSGWYSLSSEPAPPHYALVADTFRLEGDRSCGAWAECQRVHVDKSKATWQFRMQGHDETFPAKAAASMGILQTTYSLTEPITTHEVQQGESLARIAQRYYGRQVWQRLFNANRSRIADANLIYPNQRLYVPRQ